MTSNMDWNLNSTSSFNESFVEDNIKVDIPVLISASVIGFLSVILNGGVFILVIKTSEIKSNPYHFLVMMLSVSDFFVGLSNVFICPCILIPSRHKSKILVVVQTFMLTNGLYLSLLQIFLISLQRFTVVCTKQWNRYVFCGNRKYVVCIISWFLVVTSNVSLVSPPDREYNRFNDRFLSFVYSGRFVAFSFYNRLLTLTLFVSTLSLYFITIGYVIKNYKQVRPHRETPISTPTIRWRSTQMDVVTITVREANCQQNLPPPEEVIPQITTITYTSNLLDFRYKKVKETLLLVGLLITVLFVLTGPLMIAVWIDDSSQCLRISFCVCAINSLANPFIYLWKLANVRKYVKSAFMCTNSENSVQYRSDTT